MVLTSVPLLPMLVLSANMLGDWLRVRLDPQLRNR
jgi:ABC-type dipeptide/oligopeptide/nickel transport system permease subunit